MVESTIIRSPNLRQLHGRLCSPSGWDHIDNLTEKAQQAPAACTARLAPFGACCILRQTSRQIRFTRNPEMATPRGLRGCWRCQPACAIALLLPRLKVLFPLPTRATGMLHEQQSLTPRSHKAFRPSHFQKRRRLLPADCFFGSLVALTKTIGRQRSKVEVFSTALMIICSPGSLTAHQIRELYGSSRW